MNTKLMTHVVIGYPSIDETVSLVKTMEKSGADFIELQIPFSDPLADGPTIMKACEKSLENGTKVKDAFTVMEKLSKETRVPLLFMSYYNLVFKYGVEKFVKDAKRVGVKGLIVPDIPIDEEENEHYFKYCRKYNIDSIIVISPNTTDERMKILSSYARGFIYVTARQGTTGAKSSLDPNIKTFLVKVRKYFKISIAVGFGISNKDQVNVLRGFANIAVVGSKIIDIIDTSEKKDREKNISKFIKEIKQ